MKTAFRLSALSLALLGFASLPASGCGGNSDNGGDKKPGKETGGAANADDAGSGGGGSGGADTTNTGGSAGTSTGVPCGSKTCEPMEGNTAAACCQSPFESKCGIASATGGCVDVPKPPANGCPALPIAASFMVTSCCTTAGMCGVDLSIVGQGCVDIATAAAQAMAMGLMVGMIPADATCVPGDGGT